MAYITIEGQQRQVLGSFQTMTVPDCFVDPSNKLGRGHGERKFYIGSDVKVRQFYNWYESEGREAKIFLLKSDLIKYMEDVESEYKFPTVKYRSNNLSEKWEERKNKVLNLQSEIIDFKIKYQDQISGCRGYVNADECESYYDLLRELSLPLMTYISAHKVDFDGEIKYYWKLFYNHNMSNEIKNGPLVFKYGRITVHRTHDEQDDHEIDVQESRKGQGKYRREVLASCKFCPITKIRERRLLVASHIKPWRASTNSQKVDKFNGFALSPLFDTLFDKGFITFTDDKEILFSECLSKDTIDIIQKCTGASPIKYGEVIRHLPLNEQRKEYLKYHRTHVYNGILPSVN